MFDQVGIANPQPPANGKDEHPQRVGIRLHGLGARTECQSVARGQAKGVGVTDVGIVKREARGPGIGHGDEGNHSHRSADHELSGGPWWARPILGMFPDGRLQPVIAPLEADDAFRRVGFAGTFPR